MTDLGQRKSVVGSEEKSILPWGKVGVVVQYLKVSIWFIHDLSRWVIHRLFWFLLLLGVILVLREIILKGFD